VTEYNHVIVLGVGVVLETTDKMAAILETHQQKKAGHTASVRYGYDLDKLRKHAQRDFGKHWLVKL
jgi:hypothetical protein